MSATPDLRIQLARDADVRPDADYVLYWMNAARRPTWNFALQRAVHWARELQLPLLIFEAVSSRYHWASDRLHRFILDGMVDNRDAFASAPVTYYPYVEPAAGAGRGLVAALAARAGVVVTDDFPCFELPGWVRAAAAQMDVRCEQIDSNGLLPMRAADRVFPTAYAFRRFLQRVLPDHLDHPPAERPLARKKLPALAAIPADIARRWPAADLDDIALDTLPIDHAVAPVVETPGGARAGAARLKRFVRSGLPSYDEDRNVPDEDGTSGLSPYLHFGHIGSHQVFEAIATAAQWTPAQLATTANGKRAGWWGMTAAEPFLDQLVTWRELGFNMCWQEPRYDQYESLPAWAQRTLADHAGDPRPHVYSLAEFESAATHDPLWNAAQTQLAQTGTIHNYLRMLWGKKILEWTESPRDALDVMIELNNKYALDGRNPNSYSGIFWVLGRYDRAWGPERPVFGKIRYMTSANTARKVRLKGYLQRFTPGGLVR